MKKSFYITTPIYYVNDSPHIGHAYTTVAADVLVRYQRIKGYQTFLLTGTDEHGQKVERTALAQGEEPQIFVDRVVNRFKELWRQLNISHNFFIRTSSPQHKKGVQLLFKRLYEKGEIYLGNYEGWYCTPCESFFTETQIKAGKCPDCKRPTEKLKEKSYFFRMSHYQDRLLKHIEDNPAFILPESRRNEIVSFIQGGLKDLSISRTAFKWGIPVPFDPQHVIYVWFDALANYLTALDYAEGGELFKKFWPARIHLVGKDILRFHAVYWPTFLMAAGLPLPRTIFAHGWWTIEGKKISKSLLNAVDPHLLLNKYGVDALRYFLLREVPFGTDGDFSHQAIKGRINSDLANDLGNLLNRTLTMVKKYFGGRIPKPSSLDPGEENLSRKARKTTEQLDSFMQKLSFNRALSAIWEFINEANKYIESSAPWKLAQEKKTERLQTVIYNCAEALRITALLILPFMPETAEEIYKQLGLTQDLSGTDLVRDTSWGSLKPGIKTQKGRQLFPRLEKRTISFPLEKQKSTSEKGKPEEKKYITLEEFQRIDLRTAKIISAEKIPGAQKILKLKVKMGEEERTIAAGLALNYSPEALIGKMIILAANLKPVKIRGVESQGMLLAADDGEKLVLAEFPAPIKSGTKVK